VGCPARQGSLAARWPRPVPWHPQHPLPGSAPRCPMAVPEPSRALSQAIPRVPFQSAEARRFRSAEWVVRWKAQLSCARWAQGRPAVAKSAPGRCPQWAAWSLPRAPCDPGPMVLSRLWWCLQRHPVPLPWATEHPAPPSPEAAANWPVAPQSWPCRAVDQSSQEQEQLRVSPSAALHRAALSLPASHRRYRAGEQAGSARGCSASGKTAMEIAAEETRAAQSPVARPGFLGFRVGLLGFLGSQGAGWAGPARPGSRRA